MAGDFAECAMSTATPQNLVEMLLRSVEFFLLFIFITVAGGWGRGGSEAETAMGCSEST